MPHYALTALAAGLALGWSDVLEELELDFIQQRCWEDEDCPPDGGPRWCRVPGGG